MTRNIIAVDLDSCIGCHSCAVVCKQENNVGLGTYYNKVLTVGPSGTYPDLEMYYLPVSCQHCDNPECVSVCPTGASYKREDGIVLVDHSKCIGCRMCMGACPYDARSFNWFDSAEHPYYEGFEQTPYEQMRAAEHPVGVVEKCVMCHGRTEEGKEPACVQTCITKSRWFGDLDDPTSELCKKIEEMGARPLKPELGTKPSVYYAGLVD